MSDVFYVATNRDGVDTSNGGDIQWNLPSSDDGSVQPASATDATDEPLRLRTALALLESLDEVIFIAEALGDAAASETPGVVVTQRARLLSKTSWDANTAARFALDCAEHVCKDAADIALPDGSSLESVMQHAREVLDRTEADAEHNLGFLARLSAVRRLRRRGEAIGDIARELLTEDVQSNADALEDPNYVEVAAVVDAVLAAVEALRALALPRYVRARENPANGHGDSEPPGIPQVISTPWGPMAFGAEHLSTYEPAWSAARNAASHARDAVLQRSGKDAGNNELSWQADALSQYLKAK